MGAPGPEDITTGKVIDYLCNFCPAVSPNFKELLDHCQREHPEKLKRYEIKNKRLKQTVLQYSDSAGRLFEIHGWRPQDCTVREYKK